MFDLFLNILILTVYYKYRKFLPFFGQPALTIKSHAKSALKIRKQMYIILLLKSPPFQISSDIIVLN